MDTCNDARVCLVCVEDEITCDGQITVGNSADAAATGFLEGPVGVCQPGTHCDNSVVHDQPGGQCRMFCEAGASCDIRCAARAGRACVRCEGGSDCISTCDETTDVCSVTCDGDYGTARTCDVTCPSPTGQCVVMCNDLCRVRCANPESCFVLCADGSLATSLGSDRYTCD
jgi:hypothetical protein